MTPEQYVKAKLRVGHRIHKHNGVWWETTRRGYCKTAIPFQTIENASSKPKFRNCLFGYSHRSTDPKNCSGFWRALIMPAESISEWSLQSSDNKKRRNAIRKGLSKNKILRVKCIIPLRNDITEVTISTAIRNRRGHPPDYYRTHHETWWQSMLSVAAHTQFWGAFHNNRLVAFLIVHVVGNRAVIDGAKSRTESLKTCPNEALVATFIEYCRDQSHIAEIWYGHWSEDKPTLNRFKASFGFCETYVPYRRFMLGGLWPLKRG